ncbi:NPC intracellular cholesterol transporter 2 [Hetaerina americana]|uniref:NPC intracellular cholesterol transporter 2 n=1 Tax=Hetaerina americana TaxID=62018 RepID=UPI003A7F1662
MKFLVAGVLLLMSGAGCSVVFEDCSGRGEVYEVDINDCPKEMCTIAVGTTINITMQFSTNVPADVIKEMVFLVINEVEHDVIARPEPCNAFDEPGCPLKTGDVRVYRAQATITNDTPPVKADLVWILKNEKEDVFACFATRIHLVNIDRAVGHPRQRAFRSWTA